MVQEEPIKLDRIDRRILVALDYNARIAISDLARALKLGRDIVSYRLERLTKEGVILRAVATINPAAVGRSIFKTYVRLHAHRQRTAALLRTLRAHSQVLWHAQSDGAWDLMMGILASNSTEAYALQREILGPFNDLIVVSNDAVLVETHAYRKNYLLHERPPNFFLIGGVPRSVALDALDQALIQVLSAEARVTLVELANRTKSTVDIVRNRIARLERGGVITGYRIELNLDRIGVLFVKAMLTLRHRTVEEELAFEKYCAATQRVTYFIRQLGACPIELELEVGSYAQFYRLMDEIKEKFPGLIKNIESLFVRSETYRWSLS